MVEYVKEPAPNRWCWCKSRTQYSLYVAEKRSGRPSSDLCDQCKTKEDRNECMIKKLVVKPAI